MVLGCPPYSLVVARGYGTDLAHSGDADSTASTLEPAYDFPNSTVLLKDPKGRGGIARDHLVPLTKMALDVLETLRVQNGRATGPFVTRGEQSLHPSTVSKVVTTVWRRGANQAFGIGCNSSANRSAYRSTCSWALFPFILLSVATSFYLRRIRRYSPSTVI